MTEKEYKNLIEQNEKVYHANIMKIKTQFCVENAKAKIGDIVSDNNYTIRVRKINWFNMYSVNVPNINYFGTILTKKMVENKCGKTYCVFENTPDFKIIKKAK